MFKSSRNLVSVGVFLLIMLGSCKKPEHYVIPEEYLQREEMTAIMKDIVMSEAWAKKNIKDVNGGVNKFIKSSIYPGIFHKHGIADSVFYKSFAFYESMPLQYQILMDLVKYEIITERDSLGITQ